MRIIRKQINHQPQAACGGCGSLKPQLELEYQHAGTLTTRWTGAFSSLTTDTQSSVRWPRDLLSSLMPCSLARVSCSDFAASRFSKVLIAFFAKQLFQGLLGGWREDVQPGGEDSNRRVSGNEAAKQEQGADRRTETRRNTRSRRKRRNRRKKRS